jgi:pimeloyl-ACP methyl ester carboxylesterase
MPEQFVYCTIRNSELMKRFFMKSMLAFVIILTAWIIFAQSCMTFRKADKEMKKEFQQKGVALKTATEKIDGRNMHYAQTGNDSLPTIVFIHGTPGSWNAFAGYLGDKELLQKYRMISIDRPGFGYSDFGEAENLRRQSELLSPLLHKIYNGKPIYLVGHSLGGPLIILLSADNPDFFAGLVLISGSVDPSIEKPERWRPLLFNTPLNLLVPGAFRPSNVELWYLKKDLVKLKEAYNKINCPVYFIHGDKDTWVPPENVSYAKKLLVHAKSIEEHMLSGGGHFIPWTKYKEIKEVLLKLHTEDQNNNSNITSH